MLDVDVSIDEALMMVILLLEPVPGYPPQRIVDDADVNRFLDSFVGRLLGPVNSVCGSR